MNVYILMEYEEAPRDLPILASLKKKDIISYLKKKGYSYSKENDFYYAIKQNGLCSGCVRIEKTKMIGNTRR